MQRATDAGVSTARWKMPAGDHAPQESVARTEEETAEAMARAKETLATKENPLSDE